MLRESVVQIIHGGVPIADLAAHRITVSSAWRTCAHLANRWGALPRLKERASSQSWQIPEQQLAEINTLALDGYVHTLLAVESGLAVLQHFQKARLRAVAFKGLASMACLYSELQTRVLLDVDLLISESDLPRAIELLAQVGFQPEVKANLSDYLHFVRHAPGFGGNEVLSFRNRRGNTIDLHWRLGSGFDPYAILRESREAALLGKVFPVVCARDGLLLCVHHSLRNHFSPDRIMRDLMDLERWCDVINAAGELERTLEEAARKGLTTPLLVLTRILRDLNPNGAAAKVAAEIEQMASDRQARDGADLHALFLAQVESGEIERDLLYLFRPHEMGQILKGLLYGGSRHVAISHAMEEEISKGSAGLWTRMVWAGRALRHLRPGRIRQLRALARTKDGFGASASRLSSSDSFR